MRMPWGDFFDRWTILRMKARLDAAAAEELSRYEAELAELTSSDLAMVMGSVAQLAETNAKIWLVEASIRQEYGDDAEAQEDLSLEEVGRRALRIREYNKLRIQAKNRINSLFGDAPDNKVQHASQ